MSRHDTTRTRPAPWRRCAIACLCLVIAGCNNNTREELTRVDSEKEANRVLVELESRGITQVQKASSTENRKTVWSVTVPASELSAARTILVQCDLPREVHSGFASIAESSSLIPSKSEERAKLLNAMAGELQRTFETYDRVVSARVQIALPDKDPLARDATTKPSATAMVLIKYTPLPAEPGAAKPADPAAYPDAPVQKEDVQQMVARSVDGLTAQNVFVTYTKSSPRAAVAAATASPAAAPAATTPETGNGKKLTMQLFGAVAVFGVISILLTALLVKEKRRQRLAATP